MKLSEKLNASIDRLFNPCWKLGDYITNHPETGGCEKEAVSKITEFLAKQGYEITAPYGDMPYSFLASDQRPSSISKPKAALLCEYDALPEVGHGCGHSISGAISILSALALRDAYPDFPFRLDIIGTPNEEAYGGKVAMAKNHAFDGYEFAIMGHLDNRNYPQIKIVACDGIYVIFKGNATHAASSPELGVNALNAAQFFMHASDMLRQHIPPDCQIHGIVVKGGEVPNTVPERVELDFYYRAATMEHMNMLKEKLMNCIRGACIATGCTYELKEGYTELYADLSYLPTAIRTIGEIFDALHMPWEEMKKAEGSTDAGNVDLIIPTFHLELQCTDKFADFHTREFEQAMHGERGKKTLRDGARVIAQYINHLAENPDVLRQIQKEHREYRGVKL